jgi:cation diffusion facilitator CzcD-associated flavoprotein CzcO
MGKQPKTEPAGHQSVAIVGTGFAGLGMAIRLKQSGYRDITLYERASEVGGTWRENTYPGAACDVPAHLYCFSFAPKPDWSRRFASQPEMHAYLRKCADDFDVRRHVRFNTEVVAASFNETDGKWRIVLADGTTDIADVLVSACGQLNRPAYPDIPGINTFEGAMFHSAEWDHAYDLAGKRVAVIGTGASAIQFVPEIAPNVASLKLFQREPPHVIPKPDYQYPAWATRLFARAPLLLRFSRIVTYWTLEPRAVALAKFPWLMAVLEKRFRRYLAQQIDDPRLRAALTPTFRMGCKRILISNDFYQTIRRPNVTLVTSGISEIRPTGLVTRDGQAHEADAILLGTGFRATDFLAPMKIKGRDGQTLTDAWRDGAEAYLGMTVSGFPNMFMLYGPNTGLAHTSIVFMLECQIDYVVQALNAASSAGARWLEVRSHVQRDFNTEIQQKISTTAWSGDCHNWYRTATGKNTVSWPGFTFGYHARVRRFRRSDFHFDPSSRRPSRPALIKTGR